MDEPPDPGYPSACPEFVPWLVVPDFVGEFSAEDVERLVEASEGSADERLLLRGSLTLARGWSKEATDVLTHLLERSNDDSLRYVANEYLAFANDLEYVRAGTGDSRRAELREVTSNNRVTLLETCSGLAFIEGSRINTLALLLRERATTSYEAWKDDIHRLRALESYRWRWSTRRERFETYGFPMMPTLLSSLHAQVLWRDMGSSTRPTRSSLRPGRAG